MANFFNNKARAAQVKAEAAAAPSSSKANASTNGVDQAQLNKPWVERYRPRTLEDVKAQDHVTTILRRMVNATNLPHLLLYGGPGTGKTSTILALCRELYGPELFSSRVLELNASDERGISVIRERVRSYAAQALVNPPMATEYRKKYPCPSFKVIILDEADSLSLDAQNALRRVMELYSKTCRFCLICNYVTRIIDPIASRTAKFRFKPLNDADSIQRIASILSAEIVRYEPGVIERVLDISAGDLRRALQLLQSGAKLVGAISGSSSKSSKAASNGARKSNIIKDEDDDDQDEDGDSEMADAPSTTGPILTKSIIDDVAGVVPDSVITHLIATLSKGSKSMNFRNIQSEVTDLVASGYAANEVLGSLYTKLMFDDTLNATTGTRGSGKGEGQQDRKKMRMAALFSERDKMLVDGAEEHLVMLDLCCGVADVLAR